MGGRINSRAALFVSLLASPWAWIPGLIFILALYSLVREEFLHRLPPLGDFVPLWAFVILGLCLFCIAIFETAYRHIRAMQPPLIIEIRNLLLRRQTDGFDIRKRREPGWETKAHEWYGLVLDDLRLIFGADYSKRFDLEIGRKENIKLQTGEKNPKLLVNYTSGMLDGVMERDLVEGKIYPAPELKQRLLDALSK